MKKIIINANEWQTRIAITEDEKLQNIYFDRQHATTLERTFFKGVITKVLPGTQNAFVDIGQEKAGYLHISEIDHSLALQKISTTTQLDDTDSNAKKPAPKKSAPDIKTIFNAGDSALVQVNKEPIYEKGAKLTTCFTLPGRFLVLMPNIPRIGISKKIESREERNRLREIVQKNLPEGMGAIIRTTSEERTEKQVLKDLNFLVKTWYSVQKKYNEAKGVEKLHEDLEILFQVIRDFLDDDVEAIIVDDQATQNRIHKFIKEIAPEYSQKVQLYREPSNIFDHFNIAKQLDSALEKRVDLKSGGSLIIETAEAMTVIDVNTGRFVGKKGFEETVFTTNLEAAQETVRQLKLRNIGGLIVIDFIDMASGSNRYKLFTTFEKILKKEDRFQSVVLKISEFGLVQMTRKRSGKTLIKQITSPCTRCTGMGFVKSTESHSYTIFREIKTALLGKNPPKKIVLSISPELFTYITTKEFDSILNLEKIARSKIEINKEEKFSEGEYKITKK